MARQVFFSFHYLPDVSRAGIVRNAWVTHHKKPFIDWADWEEVRKSSEISIKRWIDKQLEGSSVTVVLIGAETSTRKYVKYEIQKSYEKGNGLVGIYVNSLKDFNKQISIRGANPFANFSVNGKGLDTMVRTYDWISDNGYQNIGNWVESAAKAVGR